MPKGVYKRTDKMRENIRLSKIGNTSHLGFKHSEKVKQKMRLNNLGKKLSGMTKEKISLSLIGNKRSVGNIASEETRKKMSKAHYKIWYGDKEPLPRARDQRNDPAYKEWSKEVKNRDNWKCKINNKDCSGKVIAHHILPWRNYPELRYKVNNGITLCKTHHPTRREDEERLTPELQKLVVSREKN